MVLAFHQPNFLPNLGFFYKMARADIFVVTTNLQFERREGWQRRHKIRTDHGDQWLTVPVLGSQNQIIKNVRINPTVNWRRKHIKALSVAYKQTKQSVFLQRLFDIYESKNWERLVDVNMAMINFLRDELHIATPIVLDEEINGQKQDLIVNICQKYNAQVYLSGVGGRSYLTGERMKYLTEEGVNCSFVGKDLTSKFPYSTVHYIMTRGVQWVERRLV